MAKDVKYDDKKLRAFLKALGDKIPEVRVGILGSKTIRSGEINNASIGAIHEFGAPEANIPMRSFLRIPIATKLDALASKSGAFTPKLAAEVLETGSLMPWLKKLGILGEACVAGAFATKGYGAWPAWRNPNYENNTGDVLVDTTQLRDSITSEVKK